MKISWGGGVYYNESYNIDIRETIGWEILKLKNIAEWEKWSEKNFDLLLEAAANIRAGNLPIPLLKAMDYIHEHYKENIDLDRVAQAALVSPGYLSRLFTNKLNTSFRKYLIYVRMEKADRLARETRMSIKEIAFMVGFRDSNYFSKVYRKIKGIFPRDARKKY